MVKPEEFEIRYLDLAGGLRYTKPILLRLGTLQDLTCTVGTRGARDGFQTTNVKRTSF